MWKSEYKIVADHVTAQQIWQVWSEIENWPSWSRGVEFARWIPPHSEFKTGAILYMKIKGGPKFKLYITEAKPYTTFIDCTKFWGAQLYNSHELQEVEGGLQINITITIVGPLAWLWSKLIGDRVAKTTPQQTQDLIAMAKTK